MKNVCLTLSILLLVSLGGSLSAQNVSLLSYGIGEDLSFTNTRLVKILHDDVPLVENQEAEMKPNISPRSKGKLSLGASSAQCAQRVGFKLAIRDYRTNTLWMYNEETLYEIDLEEVLSKCEMGDALIFMVLDPTYRLPMHELVVGDGC